MKLVAEKYKMLLKKKRVDDYAVSFFGGMGAFSILFLVNILAARWLGPEEYGKYSLIFSIANVLSVLFIMDLDVSAAYFIAKAKKTTQKHAFAITTLLAFFVVMGIVFSVVIWSHEIIMQVTHLDMLMFTWALLLGLAIAWKRYFEGILRGLLLFKKQAAIRLGETSLVLVVFLFLIIHLNEMTYASLAQAVLSGMLCAIALYAWRSRRYITTQKVDIKKIQALWRYARFGVLNSFSTLLVKHIDKIMLVGLIGFEQLGIYSAYYTISILLSARVIQLVINVYFPIMAGRKSKRTIIKKIDTMMIRSSIMVFLLSIVVLRMLIALFGPEYTIVWEWLLVLAVYVSVHAFSSLYGWALASDSEKGYKKQNYGILIGTLAFLVIIMTGMTFGVLSVTLVFVAFVMHRLIPGIYFFRLTRHMQ